MNWVGSENADPYRIASGVISGLPTRGKMEFYDLVWTGDPDSRSAWHNAAKTLEALAEVADDEAAFVIRNWASDVYLGLGDIERALAVKPAPLLGTRSSMQTDRLLNLKLAAGHLVAGVDVATLFGPKLTRFGRENIREIASYLDIQVTALQQNEGRNLLAEWSADAHRIEVGTPLFSGHASYVLVPQPKSLHFSYSPTAQVQCLKMLRDAENTFREERDLPRIGEGWIAETALYYAIKEALPGETVVQHGRPEWLGRQHLDIYLPDRSVAIEYQGAQHDRPVAFFGGEAAYALNVERDRRKAAKCRRHGVRLIYVREGFVLSELLYEIGISA